MAAEPLFIDSGGFYALVSPQSESHERAVEIMQEAARDRRRAITTDYIIDETATLLRARALTRLLAEFFRLTEESQALTTEWVSPVRFFRLAQVHAQTSGSGIFIHGLREFCGDEGTPTSGCVGDGFPFPHSGFQSTVGRLVAEGKLPFPLDAIGAAMGEEGGTQFNGVARLEARFAEEPGGQFQRGDVACSSANACRTGSAME